MDLTRRAHQEDESMIYEVRTYTLRPRTVAERRALCQTAAPAGEALKTGGLLAH
jgi:hypothetical protein